MRKRIAARRHPRRSRPMGMDEPALHEFCRSVAARCRTPCRVAPVRHEIDPALVRELRGVSSTTCSGARVSTKPRCAACRMEDGRVAVRRDLSGTVTSLIVRVRSSTGWIPNERQRRYFAPVEIVPGLPPLSPFVRRHRSDACMAGNPAAYDTWQSGWPLPSSTPRA